MWLLAAPIPGAACTQQVGRRKSLLSSPRYRDCGCWCPKPSSTCAYPTGHEEGPHYFPQVCKHSYQPHRHLTPSVPILRKVGKVSFKWQLLVQRLTVSPMPLSRDLWKVPSSTFRSRNVDISALNVCTNCAHPTRTREGLISRS